MIIIRTRFRSFESVNGKGAWRVGGVNSFSLSLSFFVLFLSSSDDAGSELD